MARARARLRAISGFLPVDDAEIKKGTIRFNRQSILGLAPYDVARRGVVLVPERRKIFETLTVEENLRITSRFGGAESSTDMEHLFGIFPVLSEWQRQTAGYLSGGERQMLAISQALLCKPKLMLVDELSLGLAPFLVKELMAGIREMRAKFNLSILLIEQDASSALAIADYGYIMEGGRVVYEGAANKLRGHGDVQEFYLGSGDSDQHVEDFSPRCFCHVRNRAPLLTDQWSCGKRVDAALIRGLTSISIS
jgi:branched-chain amino acid transport system ATP-binding protein